MALIGTIDVKQSWFGGIILMVEEEVKSHFSGKAKRRWRRATPMDFAQSFDAQGSPEIFTYLSQEPHTAGHVERWRLLLLLCEGEPYSKRTLTGKPALAARHDCSLLTI